MGGVKNIITLGIGCQPGSIFYFLTSGFGVAVVAVFATPARRIFAILNDNRTFGIDQDA